MNRPFRTMVTVALAAAALAVPVAASAATVPVNFSNNQSGIEVTGGSYEYIQTVFALPSVTPPNGQTFLAVYLADADQSVVLSLGPAGLGSAGSPVSYGASLQNEDPTPGLPPGYTLGFTDPIDGFRALSGQKVELSESYNSATGQFTYTLINLTDDTVPVFSGQFTDLGQSFSTAFAGALFSADVYATPTAFTQPGTKTELARGTHTLVQDSNGANVTGAVKVRTAAGGSNLGVKLTAVSVSPNGQTFTVSLLP